MGRQRKGKKDLLRCQMLGWSEWQMSVSRLSVQGMKRSKMVGRTNPDSDAAAPETRELETELMMLPTVLAAPELLGTGVMITAPAELVSEVMEERAA